MFKFTKVFRTVRWLPKLQRVLPLTIILLLIEFFDELHYAVDGAALPAIRNDLGLSYTQIGLLLGLPHLLNTFVEPWLMLLGDTRVRKSLIIGGGFAILLALLLTGSALSFPILLCAAVIAHPASGAFVTLSQAELVRANPGREPQAMARWTVAGSLGNLFGPLLVFGGLGLSLGWRWSYFFLAALAALLILGIARQSIGAGSKTKDPGTQEGFRLHWLFKELLSAILSWRLVRWILLLVMSDLLLDVLFSYVPLYFTDVVGFTPAQASLVLSVMMIASLVSDLLAVPVLERISGRKLVRLAAAFGVILYPVWLVIPSAWAKIFLLVLLRFVTIGWYPVLKGEAYAALPGRPGVVLAIDSLGGIAAGALAWIIGWIASRWGLAAAMWLLLLGPIYLVFFVPLPGKKKGSHR